MSSNVQQVLCWLLGGIALLIAMPKGRVFGCFAFFDTPLDVLQYVTSARPASVGWSPWRLLLWWLFVLGFFGFLPRLDRRVLSFVFTLVLVLRAIAVRSCAVKEPFYM